MNRDEVWEQVKNDKSEIYGQPIFDVFLQVIDHLSEPHFLELNKDQISKLTGDAIFSLLYYASDIKKIADLIGENINKISINHVYELLKRDKNEIANTHGWFGPSNHAAARANELSKYSRRDAIFQYRNIDSDQDVYALLSRHSNNINNADDLVKIIDQIGEERLNYLSPISISKLLKDLSHSDETGDSFELFAKKLKSNIEKIPDDSVVELIPTFRGAYKENQTWTTELNRVEKVMKSLGENNLSKLNDRAIKHLLTYGPIKFREKIASILGDLKNKLSDESISSLTDEAMRSPYNSVKIIGLIGEKRFKKWFESQEGQRKIEDWKRVINAQGEKQVYQQHTQKDIELFRQNLDSLYHLLGKK